MILEQYLVSGRDTTEIALATISEYYQRITLLLSNKKQNKKQERKLKIGYEPKGESRTPRKQTCCVVAYRSPCRIASGQLSLFACSNIFA